MIQNPNDTIKRIKDKYLRRPKNQPTTDPATPTPAKLSIAQLTGREALPEGRDDSFATNVGEGFEQGRKGLESGFGYFVGETLDIVGANETGKKVKQGARIHRASAPESDGSFGQFLGSIIPSTIPSAIAITSGVGALGAASIAGLSISSAGNGMMEYEAYKQSKGEEVNPLKKFAVGLSYGVAEGFAERFSLGKLMPSTGGKFLLKGNVKQAEKAGLELLQRYQRVNPNGYQALLRKVGTGLYAEGGEEVFTEIVQGFTDIVYQDSMDSMETLKELPSGMVQAFIGGSLMGGALGPLSYGSQNVSNIRRRTQQGSVVLAEANGEVYEIIGQNGDSYTGLDKNGEPVSVAASDIGTRVSLKPEQFDKLLQDKLDVQEAELQAMPTATIATHNGQTVQIIGNTEVEGEVFVRTADGKEKTALVSELEDMAELSAEEQRLANGESVEFTTYQPVEAIRDQQEVIQNEDGDFIMPGEEGYEEEKTRQAEQQRTPDKEFSIGSGRNKQNIRLAQNEDGSFDVVSTLRLEKDVPIETLSEQMSADELDELAESLNKSLEQRGMKAKRIYDEGDPLSAGSLQVVQLSEEQQLADKLSQYEVQADGAKLKVINTATKKPVGSLSKYFLPKVTEFFEQNAQAYSQLERVTDNEKVTQKNYLNEVARASENPVEIAEAYLEALRRSETDENLANVELAIAHSLSANKVPLSDLQGRDFEPGQRGLITTNYGSSQTATDLPILAEIISQETGQSVSEDDLLDFIREHPAGPSKVLNRKDKMVERLEEAFKEVTGVEISPVLAQRIEQSALPFKDKVSIDDSGDRGSQGENKNLDEQEAEILRQLEAHGVTQDEITEIERAAFERFTQAEIDAFEAEIEAKAVAAEQLEALNELFADPAQETAKRSTVASDDDLRDLNSEDAKPEGAEAPSGDSENKKPKGADAESMESSQNANNDSDIVKPEIMTEEQYLATNGAGRQGIGDAALHKNKGRNSDKAWRKIVESQAQKDRELISRRSELRKEYKEKVDRGEIRPPSALEKLIESSSGVDDLESVQASRRLLKRRFGIEWKDGLTIDSPEVTEVIKKRGISKPDPLESLFDDFMDEIGLNNDDIVEEPGIIQDDAKETFTDFTTGEKISFVSEAKKGQLDIFSDDGSAGRGENTVQGNAEEQGFEPKWWKRKVVFAPSDVFKLTTGKKSIDSVYDVAHLMRQLEDEAVEHFFALYVDDEGNITPHHVSTGGTNATIVEPAALRAGVDKFNAKHVYLVHNHPSGVMNPSRADVVLSERIAETLPDGVKLDHIIMDTYKGEFIHFFSTHEWGTGKYDWNNEAFKVRGRDKSLEELEKDNLISLQVQRFSKTVYNEDVMLDPKETTKDVQVVSPQLAAGFFTGLRYSSKDKLEVVLLNGKRNVLAIFPISDLSSEKAIVDFIGSIGSNYLADFALIGGRLTSKVMDWSSIKSNLKSYGIDLQDVIQVDTSPKNRNAWESLRDEGVLREPESAYVAEPKAVNARQIELAGAMIEQGGIQSFEELANRFIAAKGEAAWKAVFANMRGAYLGYVGVQGNPNKEDLNALSTSMANDWIKNQDKSSESQDKSVLKDENNEKDNSDEIENQPSDATESNKETDSDAKGNSNEINTEEKTVEKILKNWPYESETIPKKTNKKASDFKVGDRVVVVIGSKGSGTIGDIGDISVSTSVGDVYVQMDNGSTNLVSSKWVIPIDEGLKIIEELENPSSIDETNNQPSDAQESDSKDDSIEKGSSNEKTATGTDLFSNADDKESVLLRRAKQYIGGKYVDKKGNAYEIEDVVGMEVHVSSNKPKEPGVRFVLKADLETGKRPSINTNYQLSNLPKLIKDGKLLFAGGDYSNEKKPKLKNAAKEITKKPSKVRPKKKTKNTKTASDETITDFGEKIHGARKDMYVGSAESLKKLSGDEIADLPLSKSVPEPNYKALIEDGLASVSGAFYLRRLREEIGRKPNRGPKKNRWVDAVSKYKTVLQSVYEGNGDALMNEFLQSKSGKNPKFMEAYNTLKDAYIALGFPEKVPNTGKHSLNYFPVGTFVQFRGNKQTKDMWAITKGSFIKQEYFSRKEAVDAFVTLIEGQKSQSKKRKTKFDIYRDRSTKDVFIGKKNGRDVVRVKEGFESVKEARSHLNEQYDDVLERYKKLIQMPDIRGEENRPRIGYDYLEGSDATPEMYDKAFGFRGVQFGNYVNQSERQNHMNEAYNALMDLASILGVPSQALSLGGELGLAFGARGRGGKRAPMAHYERGQVVINLTKKKGPGTLAHEWWHALDNYFSRLGDRGHEYITDRPYGTRYNKLRPEVVDAFRAVRTAIKESELPKRSAELDKRRTKAYFNTIIEMTARSFESYVYDKLSAADTTNDYLVNFLSSDAYTDFAMSMVEGGSAQSSYPYLLEDEIKSIGKAYDKLFKAIKVQEKEGGVVAMYKKEAPKPKIHSTDAIASHVEGLIKDWKTKGMIQVARSEADLPWIVRQKIKNEKQNIEGVFLDGRVYINAFNISSKQEGERTLLHEMVGHFGIRAMLQELSGNEQAYFERYNDLMQEVYDSFKEDVVFKRIVRRYKFDLRSQKDRNNASEEFIARLAEDGANLSILDKIYAFISDVLQALGLAKKMTKAQVRSLIAQARTYIDSEVSLYADGTVMRQAYRKPAPMFYSRLVEVLDTKLPGKGTPQSYLQAVDGFARKGEFKKEELAWTGLGEWLEEQEGKLSREDVIQFVNESNVELSEVMKGAPHIRTYNVENYEEFPAEVSAIFEKHDDDGFAIQEDLNKLGYEVNDMNMDGTFTSFSKMEVREVSREEALLALDRGEEVIGHRVDGSDVAIQNLDDLDSAETFSIGDTESYAPTKYGSYTLDGGKDYRELLITLPKGKSFHELEAEKELFSTKMHEKYGDGWRNKLSESEKNRFDKLVINSEKAEVNDYTNSHWDEPNVLAHVRFNTRGNTLFIEEIQSDWMQSYRKIKQKVESNFDDIVEKMKEHYGLEKRC